MFNNIQADFVHIDDLSEKHDSIYLPYPVMLKKNTAEKIKKWVENGGKLISEGCPAYFGNLGRVGLQQPNYGLDELFGVKQEYVQFTPDILGDLKVSLNEGKEFSGSLYLQSYQTTTGIELGKFEDGKKAVIENAFGKGKTLLIGTFPGYAYYSKHDDQTKSFFRNVLAWAGIKQNVKVSDNKLIARLHVNKNNVFLWITNATRETISAEIMVSEKLGKFTGCKSASGESKSVYDNSFSVTIPERNVGVYKMI